MKLNTYLHVSVSKCFFCTLKFYHTVRPDAVKTVEDPEKSNFRYKTIQKVSSYSWNEEGIESYSE